MSDRIDDSRSRLRLRVTGPFDLSTVTLLGFGNCDGDRFDKVLRLAFCLDGDYERQVGVAARQTSHAVLLHATGTARTAALSAEERDRVRDQVARTLSLDHDGAAFADLCRADPHLAAAYERAPGFRPALFHSPYEAAVCSVVSARRSRRQGLALLARLANSAGATLTVVDQPVSAVPTPRQLLRLETFPGLSERRLAQLRGVAEAAQRRELDARTLRALPAAEALTRLQRLPGIGPFYSSLILERACGHADIGPDPTEPHTRRAVAAAYQLHDLDEDRLAAIVDTWRPFRTWVLTLLRSIADRDADINTRLKGAWELRSPRQTRTMGRSRPTRSEHRRDRETRVQREPGAPSSEPTRFAPASPTSVPPIPSPP